jgi:hypothetical protein
LGGKRRILTQAGCNQPMQKLPEIGIGPVNMKLLKAPEQ